MYLILFIDLLTMTVENSSDFSEEKGCWETHMTILEKGLFAGIVLMLAMVIGLIVTTSCRTGQVCTTSECLDASAKLLASMDPSVNPCDDFYEFICAFRSTNISTSMVVTPAMVDEYQIVRDGNISGISLQKLFYQSCMNQKAIDVDNNTRFLQSVREVGGWPVLEGSQWDDRNFSWIYLKSMLRKVGFIDDSFFVILAHDDTKSNIRIPKIVIARNAAAFPMSNKETLTKFVKDIVFSLGAGHEINMDISELVEFIYKLEQISSPYLTRKQQRDEIKTLEQIELECTQIPWHDLFKSLYLDEINGNSTVIFDDTEYCEELDQLLNSTSKRTQANYLMWQVFADYADYLSTDIRILKKNYTNQPQDDGIGSSLNLFCYDAATSKFPHVLKNAFEGRSILTDVRTRLNETMMNIEEEYSLLLLENGWTRKETAKYIVQTMDDATRLIIDQFYDENKFNGGPVKFQLLTDNIITILQRNQLESYKLFSSGLYKNITDSEPQNQTMQDETFSQSHDFIASTPHIQQELHVLNYPEFINYGSLGSVFGNNMIYSLSKLARNISYENDQMVNHSRPAFAKKTQCIIDEYHEFKCRIKLNVTESSEVFIPNFLGIDAGYNAYKKWVEVNGPEKKLPGLDYNPLQIYWMQANHFHCVKISLDIPDFETDMRRISAFRVNSVVRHSKYFAKDYNCPIGSAMNPEKKC